MTSQMKLKLQEVPSTPFREPRTMQYPHGCSDLGCTISLLQDEACATLSSTPSASSFAKAQASKDFCCASCPLQLGMTGLQCAPPQVHDVVRRHYNTVYRTGVSRFSADLGHTFDCTVSSNIQVQCIYSNLNICVLANFSGCFRAFAYCASLWCLPESVA